jgi:hypothetical protein
VPALSGTPLCNANRLRSKRSLRLGEVGSMKRNSPAPAKIGVTGWTRGAPERRIVARYAGNAVSRSAPNQARSGTRSAN